MVIEMSESSYILVCPTHRRSKTFMTKTYSLLQRTNAPNPILWVNDVEDYQEYSRLFPELEIHLGGDNIGHKRNSIQAYYPVDSKIVMIDDDIKNIVVLDEQDNKKKRDLVDFNSLISLGFSLSQKYNTTMYGVYPIDNPLFLKSVIRFSPCYIIGSLFGFINKRVFVDTNYAEDFERSILYYITEKKLLRLDFIGLTTKYYKEKGGLQTTRTEDKNYNDKKILADKYPDVVSLITKRNRAELVFKNNRGNTLPFDYYNYNL